MSDEEVLWVLLLLLLLTAAAEVLEKAVVVKLPVAEVTEEATVETEVAAWTTEDCTRDATDPKNAPISDIPSEMDPDDGREPDAGCSATTFLE